jgi:hypothetical protein
MARTTGLTHGTPGPDVAGRSLHGTVTVGLGGGIGTNLVLIGISGLVGHHQMQQMAAEVGWRGSIGRGHLIASFVLIGVGLTALVVAHDRRRTVHDRRTAAILFVAGLVLSGPVVLFVLFELSPVLM